MSEKWIRVNSYLGMVNAMRRRNFANYEITPRGEMYVCLWFS